MGPFSWSVHTLGACIMAFIHQQYPICLKTSAIQFHNIIMPIKEINARIHFVTFIIFIHYCILNMSGFQMCVASIPATVHEIRHTIYCSRSCHRSFLLRLALSLSLSLGLLNAAWNTFFCPHSECTCTE